MIRTEGTLRIKKIRQSRNGAFCVADLVTDFGEFKVKDPVLDQFEEGEYQGKVWISEIYLSQYVAYGKGVTELRARLHDVQITSESRQAIRRDPPEVDPLDEAPSPQLTNKRQGHSLSGLKSNAIKAPAKPPVDGSPAPSTATPGTEPASNAESATPARVAESGDAGMFSPDIIEQIEAGHSVKLDATVERAVLRAQAAELGRRGYRFDAKNQVWNRQARD